MVTKSLTAVRLALFLLTILISSCTIGPTERSAPRTYLLDAEVSFEKPSAKQGQISYATLLVSSPRAKAGFDTPRMAYLLRPHEVSYYAFNQWADTPARMLMRLLVQAMDRTELWRTVVQTPSPVRADYRLDCDDLTLAQQFFSRPSKTRLALRAHITDIQSQSIMDARDFEVSEEAPSDDAYGGVIAANRAAARLLGELTEWVRKIMSEDGQASQ